MIKFHNLYLTAPSKTFLLGEYVALQGGPTLILTTPPDFALAVKQTSEKKPLIFEGISELSPAGKFLLHYADLFKDNHLIFHDPHHGLGGFGASSAQLLVVKILKTLLTEFSLNVSCELNQLLADYWRFAWDGEGIKPSGADVVAQLQGGISYFYKEKNQLTTLEWPFPDVNYYLIHTGHKLATHLHLKELTFLATQRLADIVFTGLQHLQTKNAAGFIQCIEEYSQAMQSHGLIVENTINLLSLLKTCPYVLAAKGCGALGADVVLVLAGCEEHDNLLAWFAERQLHLIASGNKAGAGLQLITKVTLTT